jgi:hypothetical protein
MIAPGKRGSSSLSRSSKLLLRLLRNLFGLLYKETRCSQVQTAQSMLAPAKIYQSPEPSLSQTH